GVVNASGAVTPSLHRYSTTDFCLKVIDTHGYSLSGNSKAIASGLYSARFLACQQQDPLQAIFFMIAADQDVRSLRRSLEALELVYGRQVVTGYIVFLINDC